MNSSSNNWPSWKSSIAKHKESCDESNWLRFPWSRNWLTSTSPPFPNSTRSGSALGP